MDVNFILHGGHILFFEIADDFPSTGDTHGEDMNSDFWENSNVLPSCYPANEYACVRDSMYELLLRLGFRTGVFHLEARLQNSSMAFAMKDGYMDLRQFTKLRPNPKPSAFVPLADALEPQISKNEIGEEDLASLPRISARIPGRA